jgi:hypothetical protein
VSVFRPTARTSSPDGREWEIYAYRLQLPNRGTPDPRSFGRGVTTRRRGRLRVLVRSLVDVPVAAVRALRTDEWIVEAISWAPYRASYKWSTTTVVRGQVLVLVEGALARGETPHPRNALLLEAR